MKISELFETSSNYNTQEIIDDWIAKKFVSEENLVVNDDGSITTKSEDFTIIDNMLNGDGTFPIRISSAQRMLIVSENLSSFKNFPTSIGKEGDWTTIVIKTRWKDNNRIRTLEGFTRDIKGIVDLSKCHVLSYKDVNKHINSLDGGLYLPDTYSGPLLGFLKVKDLQWIDGWNNSATGDNKSTLLKACDIINKHLEMDRDILTCQEELIEAGFKEYARL